jgi:hypothetical protein
MLSSLLCAAIDDGTGMREAVQVLGDDNDQIILALIAIIATSIAALVYTIKNNGLGKDINRAVNNVGPGEHHLIDLIKQIRVKQEEFDKKWGNLPEEMDDAVGLVELLHNMDARIKKLDQDIADHVAWEMQAKYKER